MVNPYQMMNVGFMLSFAAVLGIFFVKPKLKDYIKWDNFVVDSIITMIAVQITIIPILTYYFYEIPTYSIVANLLVLPVVPIVLVLGILCIVFSYISILLASILGGALFWLINYMVVMSEWIQTLPYSVLIIGRVSVILIGLYCISVIFGIWNKNKKLTRITIVLLIVGTLAINIYNHQHLVLHFMDVGQGDACVMLYKGKAFLIDGGGLVGKKAQVNVGEEVLLPFLKSKGGVNQIEGGVFVSHGDFDHIYGIIELASNLPIHNVYIPDKENDQILRLIDTLNDTANIQVVGQGDGVVYDDLVFTCYGPSNKSTWATINEASMVVAVNYGSFDALFLGDIYKQQEIDLRDKIVTEDGQMEVVKVAHHVLRPVLPRSYLIILANCQYHFSRT